METDSGGGIALNAGVESAEDIVEEEERRGDRERAEH